MRQNIWCHLFLDFLVITMAAWNAVCIPAVILLFLPDPPRTLLEMRMEICNGGKIV
jgi:hypothetical protein